MPDWILSSGAVFWIAIAVMSVAGAFFSHRSRVAKYKMMETLAEKGQSLPASLTPELLEAVSKGEQRNNPIQTGIILVCVGIAIAIFFWALGGGGNFFNGEQIPNWLPVIGIFPFMVGVAFLIGSFFRTRPETPPK